MGDELGFPYWKHYEIIHVLPVLAGDSEIKKLFYEELDWQNWKSKNWPGWKPNVTNELKFDRQYNTRSVCWPGDWNIKRYNTQTSNWDYSDKSR